MAFDGITTKAIASELQLLKGARIDKIFQPNSSTIVLGLYLDGINYALNICINPQNYRIHLTTHPKSNPKIAPNFCMVLRKHIIGLRIKNIITQGLERIVTIELEGFDDVDDIITSKLIIELMGKHCNIILLNDEGIIIDCLKRINNENATHIAIPHIKYAYPSINTNYNVSKKYIDFISKKLNTTEQQKIDNYLNDIIDRTNSFKLDLNIEDKNYFLVPSDKEFSKFHLNFALDDFYYSKETIEELKNARNNVLRPILLTQKKYKKRLENINQKLKDCENMDIYKIYGELITANLYKIPNKNIKEIELENYYDNNNLIKIPLDSKYTPNINAKRFFKKYHKLKNALEVVTEQKKETIKDLNYIESIIYELEYATSISDIYSILDEISENNIFEEKRKNIKKNKSNKFKQNKLVKNNSITFNPLKYNIDGFKFLVGRNNKENDYLTLKYAHKTDIWFHTKDIHGSHAILVLDNKTPDESTIIKCAEITAFHSKARLSSNVPVDTCEARFVKKPKGSNPGMVIYTDYHTLYVNPKEYK